MKKSSFLGMAQSSSKVTQAITNAGKEKGMAELIDMADRHADGDGFLVMPYFSIMVCGIKGLNSPNTASQRTRGFMLNLPKKLPSWKSVRATACRVFQIGLKPTPRSK